MKATLLLDARATLGEGAWWHVDTHQLFWVDIEERKLHVFRPGDGQTRTIDVGERIGTVVLTTTHQALVALQTGIFELDLADESLTLITNPLEGMPDIRFNDGKCDPAGRLWVGSMHLATQAEMASLYCLDTDGTITQMRDNITISNGIVWSLDHQIMYYIDTPTDCVQAFDYDLATARISHPRVVVRVPAEAGHPDGMAIDAEGMLWIAHWGGGRVIRWDPTTGERLREVEVPAPYVTSCAFGGDDLKTLYITTARTALSTEQRTLYPHSGGLFSVEPGVKGVAPYLFGQSSPSST